MNKKNILSVVVWVLVMLVPILVGCNDDETDDNGTSQDTSTTGTINATPLSGDLATALTTAYQNTAALQSYAAQWDGSTSQSTQLKQGDSLYIVSTELTSLQTAEIEGESTSSSVTQTVAQGQTVVTQALVQGASLPEPVLSSQLELKASVVSIDGQVYINLDETAPEYRAGLPEGWQEVQDDMALGGDDPVTLADVTASLENVRMDATSLQGLLNTTVVISAEALPDDELNGQAMKRYLLTLNFVEAMNALGQDPSAMLGDLELSEAALNELLSKAAYTIEVWVGAEDETVYRHVITLSLNAELDEQAVGTDLGRSEITFSHNQTDTLTLSDLNADFDIRVPTLSGIVG